MRTTLSSLPRRALGLPLALVTLAHASPSLADEKAECLAAASTGQTLRDAHSLIEAKESFQVCARPSCPALVQTDCGAWLDAVERALPTVVLAAKDGEGRDLIDVVVSVDGKPFARKLDGQAVPMNPGAHDFRFDRADGTTATSRVIVKEGEKAQEISVAFAPAVVSPPPDAVSPLPVAPPPAPADATANARALQRALALVLGGVGVAGIAVGGGIALDAKSKDDTAAAETTPSRHSDSVNAVSEGNAGTVVMVAGGVLAAAGIVVWFTAPSAKVSVGAAGSSLWLRGTF